jgi:hypothetical protein
MKKITDKMISIGAAKVKSEARKEGNQKKEIAKTTSDASKSGSAEKEEQTNSKDVGETNLKSEATKKDSHANSESQAAKEEAHRNFRFWKKRAELNNTGLLRPKDAGEELAEDSKEADLVLKTIAELNSTDNIMPEAAPPVHGLSNDVTIPTVEDRMFKSEAAEAFLRQIHCGCLADCVPNNKDSKWDGATSKAVAPNKVELNDGMDIDQAVAAMRRSKRNEPMPIKSIEFPKDYIMTATSSVTDSQAGVPPHKSMSGSWSKSNDSGPVQNGRAKSFLQKLGKKSSRGRTENQ